MNPLLLLVDIQNDYFPGGKNELAGALEAGQKAASLLAHFRQMEWPLVHIQHLSTRPGAAFFVPGTAGAETHASVSPRQGEMVFQKHFPNSFRETPLLEHLRQLGIQRLVICGMMTHMCIDATTRAAFDLGFECWLAHDGCATKALEFGGQSVPAPQVHAAFLAALKSTYARVLSVEEIIAALD